MDDWRIAAELAARFDAVFGFETVDDVQDEIARGRPVVRGCRRRAARAARATARCSRSPTSPTRSCSRACSASPPALVGADQARCRGRRVAPVLARHRRGGGERHRLRSDQARTRQRRGAGGRRSGRRGGGRSRRRELAARPELHVWDRPNTPPVPVPPDAYSLRLVAARTLYDAGRLVSSSPVTAALATGTALVVHPSDLSRIGVSAEGDDVRVTTPRGTVTLPVLADSATAPGTAFMAVRARAATSVPTTRRHRRRRSPSSAWRPRGEAPCRRCSRSPTRCSTAGSTPPSC